MSRKGSRLGTLGVERVPMHYARGTDGDDDDDDDVMLLQVEAEGSIDSVFAQVKAHMDKYMK